MKLKFETFCRGFICIFVAVLFWGLWKANGQDKPVTNAIAEVEKTAEPGHTIISIPAVLKQNESLLTFGLDRIPVLQSDLWGNPRWTYLASLIYIILAFYVSKFFDFLTRVWLKKWAERTETRLDDLLLELLNGPVKVVSFVIFLNVGLSIFAWDPEIEKLIARALDLVVVGAFVYVLLKAVDLSVGYWKSRVASGDDKTFDEQLFPVVRKSLKVFILIVAFLYVCDNVFHKDIKAIITSLSIGGLALGLAAQDTLANFFGAVVVFVDKPFRIGDAIKLPEVEGTVESIGLRSTRVRNLDGHLITVPNKTMGNATITNITRRPNIKSQTNIGLTYDTSTEKLKRALTILDEVYKSHAMTHDVLIAFNKFADSALNIQVVHWWKSTNPREQLLGMQELNLAVKKRFDEEGINFAFPSQTVYLKQDSDWQIGQPSELKAKS
jgi:MscS family membrane protein